MEVAGGLLEEAGGSTLCGSMLARTHSFLLIGIDGHRCEVEVDVSTSGQSKTIIVGLAQTAVKESADRVRRAIENSGFLFPREPLLINLAPADVKKEGPALDLAIAVGLLRATNAIRGDRHKRFLLAGELALDGRLRKIKGALSMALLAQQLHKEGITGIILPQENAREAAVVDGVEVYPCSSLAQVVSFLNDTVELEPYQLEDDAYAASQVMGAVDFSEVRGQEAVKRAITIAAAGGHNLLMVGPPGTGKIPA